ncbi:hypothetical protein GCM10015535_06500 [Streptomyces gelaticus]|uniref:Uncharacterized protein n=1 Tax=Streptomyces gelaticus TaxID=285446 RepID=A0ABQ2VRV7_9ACTN|nr:hypothetical protein GCM10015535_06500 [Streptomyces gelaticus]
MEQRPGPGRVRSSEYPYLGDEMSRCADELPLALTGEWNARRGARLRTAGTGRRNGRGAPSGSGEHNGEPGDHGGTRVTGEGSPAVRKTPVRRGSGGSSLTGPAFFCAAGLWSGTVSAR